MKATTILSRNNHVNDDASAVVVHVHVHVAVHVTVVLVLQEVIDKIRMRPNRIHRRCGISIGSQCAMGEDHTFDDDAPFTAGTCVWIVASKGTRLG